MGVLTEKITLFLGIKAPIRVDEKPASNTTDEVRDIIKVSSSDGTLQETADRDTVDNPVEECLSCKVIGSVPLVAGAGLLLYYTKKHYTVYTGFRRYVVVFSSLYLSTSTFCLIIYFHVLKTHLFKIAFPPYRLFPISLDCLPGF